MRLPRRMMYFLLIASCLPFSRSVGDDPPPMGEILSHVDQAERDRSFYPKWRSHFHRLPEDSVRYLMSHENDTVALNAAWEFYAHRRRTIAQKDASSRARSEAFCSFVEGRLHCRLPPSYCVLLEHVFTDRLSTVYNDTVTKRPTINPVWNRVRYLSPILSTYETPNAKIVGEDLVLGGQDSNLHLKMERILEEQPWADMGKVAFSQFGNDFFVAFYPDISAHYTLECYRDRDPNYVAWKAKVWTTPFIYGHSGFAMHVAKVLNVKDNGVVALGVSQSDVYFEGFQRDSGHVMFRLIGEFPKIPKQQKEASGSEKDATSERPSKD